jgi:hypothetical protein
MYRSRLSWAVLALFGVIAGFAAVAAPSVPKAVEQPGTQPFEIGELSGVGECSICHGGTENPDFEPYFGWQGGMMAHAARNPLFWAAMAIAEQDFLPDADPSQRGGAGDFCLRCHMPNGWMQGRSVPTDGSAMNPSLDSDGVQCEHCHKLVNPDPPVNIAGTIETQSAPYVANDGTDAYVGSGMFVMNGTDLRLGPYADVNPPHSFAQSSLHRSADLCGTCHDVSNPVVGDLAHNFGAQLPLDPGTYSGDPASAVSAKAAFNNKPHKYGAVERTYSEWKAGGLGDTLVNDFNSLPDALKTVGGAIQISRSRAWQPFAMTANYSDGTPRYYTCQTCHMSASVGEGCRIGNVPTRLDLPRHDQTGGGYWVPQLIQYMDGEGTLRFGGGLTTEQTDAMDAGMLRAEAKLQSAGLLEATPHAGRLVVRVTNLTGHKLITGYPEGRRMWLNVKWFDGIDALVAENGAYGQIGRTVDDSSNVTHQVNSLLDPANTVIFAADPGIDQEWATQLLGFDLDPAMVLTYDRLTDQPTKTLGQLAADAAGTEWSSFHFVLNNVILHDTRIPPYLFDRDEAAQRSALPVPHSQYGNPDAGGVYDYWSTSQFAVPPGAVRAEVRLIYQQTSWEYIQFLSLENDQQSTFLGQEGVHLLDGWLNTGQAAPLEIAMADVDLALGGIAPGEASRQAEPLDMMSAAYDSVAETIDVTYTPSCDATDHTIYFGPLGDVAGYGYSGALCHAGDSGSATFDPGPGDFFFLVVGNTGWAEGSYGKDSEGAERAEDVGTAGCDLVQDLSGTCDP